MTGVIAWKTTRARADVIELRGGGQVQGKVVPDPKNKDRVQVWLLKGRNPLSFHKGQIVRVIRQAESPGRICREAGQGSVDGRGPVGVGVLVR